VDDNDQQMQFDNGWHSGDSPNATGGHYRYNAGQGTQPHGMRLNFRLTSDSGRVIYHYATSQNGGSADVYMDGVYVSTVSYKGNAGSTRSPIFGAQRSFDVHNSGAHTFETRSRGDGEEFDDEVCVENGGSDDRAQNGPGKTTNSENLVPAGQSLVQNLLVPDGVRALSVLADAGINAPFKLIVIAPSGATVGSADASAGRAVVEAPVSQAGVYLIQLVNVGVGPVNIWTAATPLVQRAPVPIAEIRPLQITGDGSMFARLVNFGFNTDPNASRLLNYWDKKYNIDLVSHRLNSFMIDVNKGDVYQHWANELQRGG
jgi:hypothetical protein